MISRLNVRENLLHPPPNSDNNNKLIIQLAVIMANVQKYTAKLSLEWLNGMVGAGVEGVDK